MSSFVQRLQAMRHAFHRDPELGFQEVRTKARMADRLRQLGIEVHEGTGVIGALRSVNNHTCIGLRADMGRLGELGH